MKEKILETINKNLPKGYELLYVSLMGSKLYGTDNENSDTDVKFIFKPSLEDCVFGIASRNLNMNTSSDKKANSSEDIDCQGWSIQFFLDLLRQGDTNAIDILYSFTNKDAVLYKNRLMYRIFSSPTEYFDMSNMRGVLGYVVSMSDRYNLKGSRAAKLTKVYEVTKEEISKLPQNRSMDGYIEYKLEQIYEKILEQCADTIFCKYEVCQDGRKAIRIGGKVHLLDISVGEFFRRLESELERYGERSKKAMDGTDWKAVHHSYRCILQAIELLDTGKIKYPLADREFLKDIKYGKISIEEVGNLIDDGLQTVKLKLESIHNKTTVNHKLINQTILDMYRI
jgi:hypothetical protein